MSGPKVSVYTLTEEELAALSAELERQLQEMERHEEICAQAREYETELKAYEKQLPVLQQSLQNADGWVDTQAFASAMRENARKCSSLQDRLTAVFEMQDNAKAERELARIDAAMQELDGVFSQQQEQSLELEQKLADALDTTVAGLFESDAAQEQGETCESGQELPEFVTADIEKLLSLRENPHLPLVYRQVVTKAIARMKQAREERRLLSFCEVELPDILKPCETFLQLWHADGETYLHLMRRYEALCRMNAHELELVPFADGAVQDLSSRIAAEEACAKEAAKQAYIGQAMDEVMAEMGYDVLGNREVRKRNGRHFRNELYRCSTDTAISVTYADDGQIAVELGKTDDEDRLPTPAEGAVLVQQMNAFCRDFKEIEARLAARGVCLDKRLALTPPSTAYAQIINLRDYEQTAPQENEKAEEQAGRARKKRQPTVRQAGEET